MPADSEEAIELTNVVSHKNDVITLQIAETRESTSLLRTNVATWKEKR